MIAEQRLQQPVVAGIARIFCVLRELGWCLNAHLFWYCGSGPDAPCVRGPCAVDMARAAAGAGWREREAGGWRRGAAKRALALRRWR
jgi:hypothetical protein